MREAQAEELGIAAAHASSPRDEIAPLQRKVGLVCPACAGSGECRRGRRDFICPRCLGSGSPVVVEVTAKGTTRIVTHSPALAVIVNDALRTATRLVKVTPSMRAARRYSEKLVEASTVRFA